MSYTFWLGHESPEAERQEAERQQRVIDDARLAEMEMRDLAEDIDE